ncbi:hypothetical protein [Nonomuraea lactucae]|uniref:hypothetical protein n=1 Tax=Nonomuraea lactucae TaxID=2249762 RepID=UPI000DE4E727|nr:hypothetical protein [Nonomuraea lactucae]
MKSLIAIGGTLLAAGALAGAAAGPASATSLRCSASASTSSSWQSTENGETKSGTHGTNKCDGVLSNWQPGWWDQILSSLDEDDD